MSALLLCASEGSSAVRMALPPAGDAALLEEFPDHNSGAARTMLVGRQENHFRARGLLRFDVAGQIPSNSVIISVSLRSSVVGPSGVGPIVTYTLRRVLVPWLEGTKQEGRVIDRGEPASTNEVTWKYPWSKAGGVVGVDFASWASSTSRAIERPSLSFISSTGLVADVQLWLDNPGTNFGWALTYDGEYSIAQNARVETREGLVPAVLTVEFIPRPIVNFTVRADTALLESNAGHNLGGLDFVPIGVTAGNKKARGLFRFDLSEWNLPAGATVTSAVFEASATFGSGGNFIYDLYRLKMPWAEGTGNVLTGSLNFDALGRSAAPGETTWSTRVHPEVPWAAAGGDAGEDYHAVPSASVVIPGPARASFVSADVTEDVKHWLQHPESNFGWIMILRDEPNARGTVRRFTSKESSRTGEWPTLVIQYQLPASTTGP